MKKLIIIIALLALANPHHGSGQTTRVDILKLNDQIVEKKSQVKAIQDRIKSVQAKIDDLERTELTLSNQIAILDNHITKVSLDIEETVVEIEQTTLELQETEAQLSLTTARLEDDRTILAELIRRIDREDDRTALETLFLHDNLSEIMNRAKFLEDLQGDLLKTVRGVQEAKASLEEKRTEREAKNVELREQKDRLKIEQIRLADTRAGKEYLVDQARNSEYEFRNLVAGLRDEATEVSRDLSALESAARERLRLSDRFPVGDVVLSWPVPDHTITAYFRDPGYPFRRIFEHPAIDIRSPQGSPVRAAAPGYVLKSQDSGYGYSYIILLHQNGITTVYGHLSRLDVDTDKYVERGDIIGLSGGMPGTRGAGRLTTGPHLHLEVRVNGIPVNPLDYLIE